MFCCYYNRTHVKQKVKTDVLVKQQPKPIPTYKSSKYVIVGEFMQSNISLAFDKVNRNNVIIKKSMNIHNELNTLEFSNCEFIEKILSCDVDKSIIVYRFNEHRDLYYHMSKHTLSVVDSGNIVLKPILQALEFIHIRGYAHRDVKPENILFYADGCKLTDFDFCEKLPEWGYFSDREGTLLFMAPEVTHGKGCLESDIWSLGMVYYECLYNRLPLKRYNEKVVTSKYEHAFDNIIRMDSCPNPTIESILSIMLNKDTKMRKNCYHKIYRLVDKVSININYHVY